MAVSASLCVNLPPYTGESRAGFLLLRDKRRKGVHGLNESGKSQWKLSNELIHKLDTSVRGARFPLHIVVAVNTPGAIAGWFDAVEK